MEKVGKEEISVRELVKKLSLVGGQTLKNPTLQISVPRRCVCANQPIYFLTRNVTTVNLAVTSKFNYDLIMLKEIVINKLLLFREHFVIIHELNVQGVQIKSGPYCNMSNLFTKI